MRTEMYKAHYELEKTHWWYRGKRDIVLRMGRLLIGGGKEIADFGCGCGLMLKELNRYGHVVGMDFSQEALDYCSKVSNVELYQNDLAYKRQEFTNRFDFGVALDVLEHIESDVTALNNMCSYMKPGGYCILTVPANQWMWSRHDENCMHYRRYSRKEFRQVIEKAGFKVEFISYYNSFLFIPAAAVRIVSNMLGIDKDSSIENKKGNAVINSLLYKIFSLEGVLLEKGFHFPAGVSLIVKVRS